MWIAPWLERAAAADPDRLALVTPDDRLTWSELAERARRAAGRLAARGVGPGERVAFALPPGAAFVETLHACALLGAAAAPIDPRLGAGERARLEAAAATVIAAPLDGPGTPVPVRAPAPGDVLLVVHTSGTTGAPRPVALTYENVQASALGSAVALGLDLEERWLCPLPLAHVGGLMVLLRSAVYGTTAVVHPRFDAGRVARTLMAGEVTLASLVPTMLRRLLDAGVERPPRLRCVLLGGGPADPALLARARAAGVPVAQTYGMTETCSAVTVSRIGAPETAGVPLPGVRLELAADGEILVGGPTVAPGAAGADGLLRTGDLGALDARGRLSVIGRKSDTIVSGGENVAPAAVEAVLLEHPAVAEAAVYGRRDPEWGEAVWARVVARAGTRPDPAELREFCRARLAPWQVPKGVELAGSLPRTASGKLRRHALAQSTATPPGRMS